MTDRAGQPGHTVLYRVLVCSGPPQVQMTRLLGDALDNLDRTESVTYVLFSGSNVPEDVVAHYGIYHITARDSSDGTMSARRAGGGPHRASPHLTAPTAKGCSERSSAMQRPLGRR